MEHGVGPARSPREAGSDLLELFKMNLVRAYVRKMGDVKVDATTVWDYPNMSKLFHHIPVPPGLERLHPVPVPVPVRTVPYLCYLL